MSLMKQPLTSLYGKSKNVWPITIFILIFPAQQLVISTPFTPIRIYMIVVVILGLFLSLHNLVFSKSIHYKYDNIDIAIGMLFLYMLFSSLWAVNVLLAMQMAIGIILLLFTYFVLRTILSKRSIVELKSACIQASKLFIILSFSYYIVGLIQHYIFGAPLEIKEGTQVAYMYGVYFEGGILPRLRGICDSPNNFGMYGVFFLASLFLMEKISKFYVTSIIVLMVLTLSYTTYLALILMCSVFFIKRYGVKVTLFFVMIAIGALVIFVINSGLIENIYTDNADIMHRILTGSGRWEIFGFALQNFADNPLLGHGLNQAREVLDPLRHGVRSTHNNFIEILLEGGLIGATLYLVGIAILFTKAGSLKNDRNLNLWAVSSLLGFFIFSNANVTLYADSTILMLAVLASMSVPKYYLITDQIVDKKDGHIEQTKPHRELKKLK